MHHNIQWGKGKRHSAKIHQQEEEKKKGEQDILPTCHNAIADFI
jgi:hypothetical protein